MARHEEWAISRRQFVKGAGLAGAALVGMGLTACSGGSSSGSAQAGSSAASASASASSAAASDAAPSAASAPVLPAGRNLVAFFSRAGENPDVGIVEEGNTAVLAYMIAGKVVSEVFEIEPAEPYPESYEETLTIGQRELDEILGYRTQRYGVAYLLGIPTLFIYTLVWMARIAEELKDRADELGIPGRHTSFRHMFCWNVFGLLFFGPMIATKRFFDTLNKVEAEMNKRNGDR